MTQKNNPMRFTVQFSPGDPCHQQTVDILNQQGRRKAQFIVNAVMHYINCSETPDVKPAAIDTALIEGIVRRLLNEQGKTEGTGSPEQPQRKVHKSESISIKEAEDTIGAEGMAAIMQTMAGFRR